MHAGVLAIFLQVPRDGPSLTAHFGAAHISRLPRTSETCMVDRGRDRKLALGLG